MATIWRLSGFCPECKKSVCVMESEKIKTVEHFVKYYSKMEKDNRATLKCEKCGAHLESFVVNPVWKRPEKVRERCSK
ncbi:hypothetical protein [Desulfosporosinus sp. BG]|uniref:hypothetical protein n=1 Tax=Desulfosporosinus sp. BG TaxID=1633135 RepID=UPI00083AA088|nr:hypothetical protein [Desulfosporosinus sp. BG]ODA41070.1 hypothetical protein DSBG_2108 [Desulfosporosinus sp. BG]